MFVPVKILIALRPHIRRTSVPRIAVTHSGYHPFVISFEKYGPNMYWSNDNYQDALLCSCASFSIQTGLCMSQEDLKTIMERKNSSSSPSVWKQ